VPPALRNCVIERMLRLLESPEHCVRGRHAVLEVRPGDSMIALLALNFDRRTHEDPSFDQTLR
jgi:hypothetical protein